MSNLSNSLNYLFQEKNDQDINSLSESEKNKLIEKLPTISKITIVQYLLKKMASIKERFIESKKKMIENIEINCFKFYKTKIGIKEIYDYCNSGNPEEYITYNLLKEKDTNELISYKSLEEIDFIHNFFFELQKNNSLMLLFISKLSKDYFEQFSYFMVHLLYENTICSTFMYDELMLITYLLLEKLIILDIPKNITNKNLENNKKLFSLKDSFLYYYLKAFARKSAVRNFLIPFLSKIFSDVQSEKELLNIDLNSIIKTPGVGEFVNCQRKISERNIPKNLEVLGNSKDEFRLEKINFKSSFEPKSNFIKAGRKTMAYTNNPLEIKVTPEQNEKMTFDIFFIDNEITTDKIFDKINKLKEKEIKTRIDLSMIEYLNTQICDEINDNKKNEKYSLDDIKNSLIDFHSHLTEKKYNELLSTYKKNYKEITSFIDDFLNTTKENIHSFPYSVKCIMTIIGKLFEKKFFDGKPEKNSYKESIFKLNFLFGCIILPVLSNPNYNGAYNEGIISKNSIENLQTITNIIEKLSSGELFSNFGESKFTIFNKYIIDTMPQILDIILTINIDLEKNFKLPDKINELIENCDKINDPNRDINYNYFKELPNENIQFKSICFSLSDCTMFLELLEKNRNSLIVNNKNIDVRTLFEIFVKYRTNFASAYEQNKINKKLDYLIIYDISYRDDFLKVIDSMIIDDFDINNYNEKDTVINKFKKCLADSLCYTNNICKENFSHMIKRENNTQIDNYSSLDKFYLYNKNKVYKKNFEEENNNILKSSIISNNKTEDLDFKSKIFPEIMSKIKNEIGYNLDSEKLQKIIFYMSYLQIHLFDLPKEYCKNNYSKLFMDIMENAQHFIKEFENRILNHFYWKIKSGDKLNLITYNYFAEIKNMKKYFCIKFLYDKLNLKCYIGCTRDTSSVVTDIKFKITKEKEYNIKSIQSFITAIPNFRRFESKVGNLISYEDKLGLSKIIKTYFKELKNELKKEKIIYFNQRDEYNEIGYELENYILLQIYEKIYPTIQIKEDKKFYNKCHRLNFLKPENVIKNKKMINEKLLLVASSYVNEMDKKFTPADKIKIFGKAFVILQNSMNFSSGVDDLGIDDTLPLLIYVVLKAEPKNINTNFNFCKYFLDPELEKKMYGILLTQLGMVIRIITEMKYTDLIGVTEEEFGKDDDDIIHENNENNTETK